MPSLDLGSVVGPQGEQGATGAQGIRGEQGLPGPNQVTNSTATPLTGVLTGNGSVVGVANIDAAPTADSTGFAQSGGTDKAIKGRVPVYGLGKNLLDNWYLLNPVNQRGQSSYSTDGAYTIDRWKLGGAVGTATFDSGGALLTSMTLLAQLTETTRIISGAQYTISALWSDGLATATGTLTVGSGISGWQISSGNATTGKFLAIRQFNGDVFQLVCRGDGTNKAIAAKLELGTEQTLCHNEGTAEAPVWVLNEIPDYEYELYRCMTSTADSSDTCANKTLATGQELAYVENGTTASRAYSVGEYFCWHGALYKAKTAIGNGDTFTENTNCEQVTGGLNDLNSVTLYNIPLNSGYSLYSGGIAKYGKTKNGIVTVSAAIRHGTTDISPFGPFTLPDGFRPRQVVTFLARNDNHGYLIMGSIDTSGIATFYSLANAFGSGATFNTGLAFRDVYFDVTFLAS